MAEDTEKEPTRTTGDTMIVATDLLKPPKARTALKILPTTVAWEQVAIVGISAFLGFIVGVIFFGSMRPIIMCTGIGGVIGYILPSLSPLEGESIMMWFGLQAKDMTAKKVDINGRKAKMYVGTYPLRRTALGATRLLPSAGSVKAESYDERGYPELRVNKSATAKLMEQKKLRTRQQSRGMKASTTLRPPEKKRLSFGGGKSKSMAAPRVPKARYQSVQDVMKGAKKSKRRSAKRK